MEACAGDVKKGAVGMDERLKLSWMSWKISFISLFSTRTLLSKIKRDVRYTDTITNNIITNTGGMHKEVLAKLLRTNTTRRDVRRQRAVNRPYAEIPGNALFEITNAYNVSSRDEQFVHYYNRRDEG